MSYIKDAASKGAAEGFQLSGLRREAMMRDALARERFNQTPRGLAIRGVEPQGLVPEGQVPAHDTLPGVLDAVAARKIQDAKDEEIMKGLAAAMLSQQLDKGFSNSGNSGLAARP